jgi:hypothetical protein
MTDGQKVAADYMKEQNRKLVKGRKTTAAKDGVPTRTEKRIARRSTFAASTLSSPSTAAPAMHDSREVDEPNNGRRGRGRKFEKKIRICLQVRISDSISFWHMGR